MSEFKEYIQVNEGHEAIGLPELSLVYGRPCNQDIDLNAVQVIGDKLDSHADITELYNPNDETQRWYVTNQILAQYYVQQSEREQAKDKGKEKAADQAADTKKEDTNTDAYRNKLEEASRPENPPFSQNAPGLAGTFYAASDNNNKSFTPDPSQFSTPDNPTTSDKYAEDLVLETISMQGNMPEQSEASDQHQTESTATAEINSEAAPANDTQPTNAPAAACALYWLANRSESISKCDLINTEGQEGYRYPAKDCNAVNLTHNSMPDNPVTVEYGSQQGKLVSNLTVFRSTADKTPEEGAEHDAPLSPTQEAQCDIFILQIHSMLAAGATEIDFKSESTVTRIAFERAWENVQKKLASVDPAHIKQTLTEKNIDTDALVLSSLVGRIDIKAIKVTISSIEDEEKAKNQENKQSTRAEREMETPEQSGVKEHLAHSKDSGQEERRLKKQAEVQDEIDTTRPNLRL